MEREDLSGAERDPGPSSAAVGKQLLQFSGLDFEYYHVAYPEKTRPNNAPCRGRSATRRNSWDVIADHYEYLDREQVIKTSAGSISSAASTTGAGGFIGGHLEGSPIASWRSCRSTAATGYAYGTWRAL